MYYPPELPQVIEESMGGNVRHLHSFMQMYTGGTLVKWLETVQGKARKEIR